MPNGERLWASRCLRIDGKASAAPIMAARRCISALARCRATARSSTCRTAAPGSGGKSRCSRRIHPHIPDRPVPPMPAGMADRLRIRRRIHRSGLNCTAPHGIERRFSAPHRSRYIPRYCFRQGLSEPYNPGCSIGKRVMTRLGNDVVVLAAGADGCRRGRHLWPFEPGQWKVTSKHRDERRRHAAAGEAALPDAGAGRRRRQDLWSRQRHREFDLRAGRTRDDGNET